MTQADPERVLRVTQAVAVQQVLPFSSPAGKDRADPLTGATTWQELLYIFVQQ